jgi:hypothetical protein
MRGGDKERIIIHTPFNPIKTVSIDYPEILKKEGVAARMLFSLSIDREGNVRNAMAWNSFYPDIEETLEKAFLQWKFEPYILEGEPIRVFGFVMVIFFPGNLIPLARQRDSLTASPEEELTVSYDKELQMVLDRCAEYCLKLSESALFYVCDEEMKEKFNKIEGSKQEVGFIAPKDLIGRKESLTKFGMFYNTPALVASEKHVLVYDYQLIKKEGAIKEKRILLEKNGKKEIVENVPHGIKPSYNLKPIFTPIQILGIGHRSNFSFSLAPEEKIKGKAVYVIEARLKPGNEGNIKQGKIWVDKSDCRIVKTEVESNFLPGYEHILSECYRYYLKPHFYSTHYYEIDKNGLLFPSKSEIRVEYSGFLRKERKLKSEVKITYRDYKFFTVKTDHEIIKKKLEALLSNRSRLPIRRLIRLSPGFFRRF